MPPHRQIAKERGGYRRADKIDAWEMSRATLARGVPGLTGANLAAKEQH